MAVGRGEEDQFEIVCGVTVHLGVREEGIAGDYYRRGIGARASLHGNTASMGSTEAEEVGESTSRVLFDHGQCWGDFVGVYIGIEGCKDQLSGEAGGVG